MASFLVRVCCVLACATALADEGGGTVVWGRRRGRAKLQCAAAAEARRAPHHLLAESGGARAPAAEAATAERHEVAWTRDGAPLPEARAATLRAEREGTYRCAVRTAAGVVLGENQTVKFASLEKLFSEEPTESSVRVGQPVALHCRPRSTPPANITWHRDRRPLPDNDRYYVLDSGDLLITDAAEEDAGNYSCVASNLYANRTRGSRAAPLAVLRDVAPAPAPAPPALLPLGGAAARDLRAGDALLLPCAPLGWPTPQVEWLMRAEGAGGMEARALAAGGVLRVRSVDRSHAGNYTCRVRGHEHINQSWVVRVTEPARITSPPQSIHKPSAGVVRFECAATGHPPPELLWYKNGEPLALGGRVKLRVSGDGSNRTQLVISGAQPSDAGVYQCFARSGGSVASAWATLGVAGGSLAGPAAVRCRPRDLTTLHLEWQPLAPPPASPAAPPASPPAPQGIFYTVSYLPTEGCEGERCQEQIQVAPESASEPFMDVVVSPLVPYMLYVRAYYGKDASRPSHKILCQGQGVPVRVSRESDGVSVEWREAAALLPRVTRWRLQRRPRGGAAATDLTLDAATHNYTLPDVSFSDDYEVRLLATTSEEFLQQDLSELAWTSTLDALAADSLPAANSEGGRSAASVVPTGLAASGAWARGLRVSWRCDACESAAGAYSFVLCYKKYDPLRPVKDVCVNSDTNEADVGSLEPGTQYEFRVQALLQRRRGAAAEAGAAGAPFSDTLLASTTRDESRKIKKVDYEYIDDEHVLVHWSVFDADALPDGNTSVIYTVHYSQNLTRPLTQWRQVLTPNTSIVLTGLERRLKTYVMVSSRSRSLEEHGPVVEVPPRAPAAALPHRTLLGVVAGSVVALSCLLCCAAALCLWRRRKLTRARTQRPQANGEEDGTEMTITSGSNVNGERRGVDEPLLNGYAPHAPGQRTEKTPNGRYRRRHGDVLDMSRRDDVTLDTTDVTLDTTDVTLHAADVTPNALDVTLETSVEGDASPAPSLRNRTKLPDGNMNLQRAGTLPPNG